MIQFTTKTNTTNNTAKPASQYSGYFSIAAWLITIGIFLLIARFRVGYTLLMFFCIASIIIVFAIGSPTIIKIFNNAALTTKPGQGAPN